jgi:carbon monoxide dehydrogenase subunit G
MQLTHTFTVPVSVEQAWQALLDIERIAPCMPGATLSEFSGDEFQGKVKVKVGPVQVTYNGVGKFTSKDADARTAVIEASGKEARGSGTAMATITAHLVADGADSTKVDVTTDLAITGRPAQFGRGVMVEVGNKLLGQFASCLADELGKADDVPAAAAGAASTGGVSVAAASANGTVDDEGATPAAMVPPTSPPTGDAAPVSGPSATDTPLEGGTAPTAAAANGRAAASIGAATKAPTPAAARPTSDTIDLLDVAGPSIAKRLLPVAAAVAVLLVFWSLVRRRRD